MSLPPRGARFIVQYGEQNTASVCRRPFRSTEKPPPHGGGWILLKYADFKS